MRWPWQKAEVRNYTDSIVSALTAHAAGTGGITALSTAALQACAQLYANALGACAVTGPPGTVAAFDATWRSAVAASLVRYGSSVHTVSAHPQSGLVMRPVASWDMTGGSDPASWRYSIQRAGPSVTEFVKVPADEVLHLRWQVDPARPWIGVAPMAHASDSGTLAGWMDRRLREEASMPTGAIVPVAKFEPEDDADLDSETATDPLAQIRQDLSGSKGQLLLLESAMASADSMGSAPRRDWIASRFGADPPTGLIELRRDVGISVASACGIPSGLVGGSASAISGQLARESWRQFVSTAVDGLCRRIEAQVSSQLGIIITIDSSPLGGRDVLARASAFRRLIEAGLSVDDARAAAGI